MPKLRVLRVGPSLKTMGGISAILQAQFKSDLVKMINMKHVSTHIDGPRVIKAGIFFYAVVKFIILCLFLRPHIIHIHLSHYFSFYRKLIIFIIAKIFKRKVIIHLHCSNFAAFHDSSRINGFFIRKMFDSADTIIISSEYWRALIESYTRNRNISILFNSVDAKTYAGIRPWELAAPVKNILFMGYIGGHKGVYDIIKLMPRIKKLYPDARFIFAGNGEIRYAYNLCKVSGVTDIVEFPGWVTGAKKINYYAKACIYLLPSYGETMPVSILEAIASGLPVVSTTVGGIPEIIEDKVNGYLVPPGDIGAIADRLSILLNSDDLRRRMGVINKQKAADVFDVDMAVKKLFRIYERV